MGDFNGDGRPDVATASNDGGTVSILLGNGDGTFQEHRDFNAVHAPATSIAVGDFNEDGNWNLLECNNALDVEGTASIFLGNGDGTLQPHLDYELGVKPSAVVTGLFDVEGGLDFAVANSTSGTVSVLLNLPSASLSFLPSSLDFGTVSVGSVSVPQMVTVRNPSGVTLDISSVAGSGDYSELNRLYRQACHRAAAAQCPSRSARRGRERVPVP